jgi:hypothetical protein
MTSRAQVVLTSKALRERAHDWINKAPTGKVLFMHACGRQVQFLPALDGGAFVPYGQSSSDLSVAEMTELLEFMFCWGAENGVVWSDPTQPHDLAEASA